MIALGAYDDTPLAAGIGTMAELTRDVAATDDMAKSARTDLHLGDTGDMETADVAATLATHDVGDDDSGAATIPRQVALGSHGMH